MSVLPMLKLAVSVRLSSAPLATAKKAGGCAAIAIIPLSIYTASSNVIKKTSNLECLFIPTIIFIPYQSITAKTEFEFRHYYSIFNQEQLQKLQRFQHPRTGLNPDGQHIASKFHRKTAATDDVENV